MNWFLYKLENHRWVKMSHPETGKPLGYITYQSAEYAFACLSLAPAQHCIGTT